MKKYIGKRIISFLIVLVGVSILSFLLIAWSGKDPAEIIAHRGVSNPTPEQIEMIRVEMGLDQPLPVRYIQWLSGMFTGELGTSLTTHQPIVKDLHKYLATTTSLVGMAILWIIVLTVPVSLLCARKRNRLFDQVTRGITICGICVPTFWLGFLLLLFFAIHLKWFSVLPSPGWRGFLLPSFALAVPSSCSLIRIMRSSLLAELSSDYVRFAKARGLSANRILVCHILRILEAQHGSVRSVEVAEYMNVSKAIVSHAVALLKKNGFLKMNQDYDFVLTDSGRAIASCIYEKHCYFKDISCKEIAMQALKTACTFYGGDWAGTLEVDLDFDV